MKRFVTTFFISVVIFSLLFFKIGTNLLDTDKTVAVGEEDILDDTVNTSEKEDDTKEEKDDISFILFGIDDEGLNVKKGARSDTIIAVNVNFDNGKIKMLTIPRDTRVNVRGKMDKINHAHSYGGPELAIKTINDFLGTDIDKYVSVDFKGVMDIVNIVGGVKMDVPVYMKYDDPTAKPPLHINVAKGEQILDGKNSHDVLRFRHYNGQEFYPGGFSREEVQQMWLKQFGKTVLSPKNILRLPKIVEASFKAIDTNVGFSTIIDGALKANKLDPESIEMNTIPIVDQRRINGLFYFIADEKGSRDIADEIFN